MNKEGKNVYRLFPCRRLSRLQKIRRREKRLFLPHLRGLYLRGLRKEKQRRLSPLFFAAGKIQLILPGPLPRPVFFNSSDFVFARGKNRKKELAKPSPPTANRKEKPPSPRGQGKTSYPLYSQTRTKISIRHPSRKDSGTQKKIRKAQRPLESTKIAAKETPSVPRAQYPRRPIRGEKQAVFHTLLYRRRKELSLSQRVRTAKRRFFTVYRSKRDRDANGR